MTNTLVISAGARTLMATGNPALIIAGGIAIGVVMYAKNSSSAKKNKKSSKFSKGILNW